MKKWLPLLFIFMLLEMIPVIQLAFAGPAGQDNTRSGSGYDADGFLWGAEVYPSYVGTVTKQVLKDILPIRYLKVRVQVNSFSTKEGKTFSPEMCLPSPSNCIARNNMDDVVNTFQENGWSMIPMISHNPSKTVTPDDLDSYADFVDWFLSRYRIAAKINYIELTNAPFAWENMTIVQLAELQNKVYDRIKGKYPEIMVGTPGFEYSNAPPRYASRAVQEIEYFLDKKNNMKFDFWAFHGYPALDWTVGRAVLPPTKRADKNKYAGPAGIAEIRRKLDSNGWSDRMIIDTEHVNVMSGLTPRITDEEDMLTAAYTVQELLIKRTLVINGRYALYGIISLNIGPRGSRGAFLFASLKPDGSPTRTVRGVGLLVSKLMEFKYAAHISGSFDEPNQPWIEKFQAGKKALYIYFKPFTFQKGQSVVIDGKSANYTLTFSRKPSSLVLTSAEGKVQHPAPGQSIVLETENMPQFLEVSYD